jgi:serine/threonine protein kinase
MDSDDLSIEGNGPPPGVGTLIGVYRVDGPLGEGGMGTVYRATDTKLNRPVAIKLLSDEFADKASRHRFQREAQLASSLNHPHILTVYDVGEYEGRQYLVTEFVDGGTLKDWIKAEKRTPKQIIELLTGVADGLAAAHEAKITHRDIKPANILIAKNGYAKLADFGLAKLHENPDKEATKTFTEGPTKPGLAVGTVAYMSPEQASGQKLDGRSDIFSFGIVLYEMLAGKRPFRGNSDLEVLKTIIHGEAEPLPPETPGALRAIVEKSLEKDPAVRYQTARDLVVDLRRSARSATQPVPSVTPGRKPIGWAIPVLATLAVVALLAAAVYWRLQQSDYFWRNPFEGATFQRVTDWPGTELDAAISHDGKLAVFLADRDGFYDAFVTQIGSGVARNLTKDLGKDLNLLHETTRTTGFDAAGQQIWLRTGPLSLTAAANQSSSPNLSLISPMGGSLRPFLTPSSLNPVWSQDGSRLIFHHSTKGDPIMVAGPDGRDEKEIFKGREGEHLHYVMPSPDQRYIYFVRLWRSREGDVWRVPAAGGTPEQITHQNSHIAYPVLLDNRMLLYRATSPDGGWAVFGMDVERRVSHQLTSGVEEYQSISASADGRRILAAVANPVANLWKIPITSGVTEESSAQRVAVPAAYATSGRYGNGSVLYLSGNGASGGLWEWKDDGKGGVAVPLWSNPTERVSTGVALSPDRKSLAFAVRQNGRNVLHVTSVDGTAARPLTRDLDLTNTPSWSPDGEWLAVSAYVAEGPRIFKVSVKSGEIQRLTDKPSTNAVWSPRGDRIVYYDRAAGSANDPLLAVTPAGTPAPMPGQLAHRGDREGIAFLPDGKSLILLNGQFRQQEFFQINLDTGERREFTRLKPGYQILGFDVSRDGKEILFDRVLENSDIVLIERK